MPSSFISAADFAALIPLTSLTAQTAVQQVLTCTRVSRGGARHPWPEASTLKVRDVVSAAVISPDAPRGLAVSGQSVVAFKLAQVAHLHLCFSRQPSPFSKPLSAEQRDALNEATLAFLRPYLDHPVHSLLKAVEAENGFFAEPLGFGPDEVEASLCRDAADPKGKFSVKRVLNQPFEGNSRLLLWRNRMPELAFEGECVFEVTAVLEDKDRRTAAYAEIRLVYLPEGLEAAEARDILDSYGNRGLQLGVALERYIQTEDLYAGEVFDGRGILHLQKVEVRHDLRGAGLGSRFLGAVLPAAVKGLSGKALRHLALAVQPLQFKFPLQGLTPELMEEGLDATERLHAYFERTRPQDAVPGLQGTALLYLATDPRATGSASEQMHLLGEAALESTGR